MMLSIFLSPIFSSCCDYYKATYFSWWIWHYAGKDINDPRVLTDAGDVPIQELRDCGVDDDRLMNIISESVKLVMEEVSFHL